jgi:hypothetical protein
MANLNWIIPTIASAAKDPKVASLIVSLWEKWSGRRPRLAVTGMQGIGKSLMVDTLLGKSLKPGYRKPEHSETVERQVLQRSRNVAITIVPGQVAKPRMDGLAEVFASRKPIDGVIHVVGYGYATIRDHDSIQKLIKDRGITTLSKYRKAQLETERNDFIEVCQYVRQSHAKHRLPQWMILAVNKIDLFHDELAKARSYYTSENRSPFFEELTNLTRYIGSDFFRWQAVPICSWGEDFEWNGKVKASQIDSHTLQQHLLQFMQTLESYYA